MFPAGTSTSPGAAPLPPLPNLSGGGQGTAPGGQSPMADLLSGVAPVKSAVDQVVAACKQIVQSGSIPGSEQICGQIVALASSLLPMAVQQAMRPGSQSPSPVGTTGGPSGVPPVGGV